jgi:hypothetical protein
LQLPGSGRTVPVQTFGSHLQRVIDGDQLTVHDLITRRVRPGCDRPDNRRV